MKEYDLVIGYQEGESNDLAVKLHAKKHAIWYHSNFRIYKKYEGNNRLNDLYDLADNIVFVTKDSCDYFVEENIKLGSVIRFYIFLNCIKPITDEFAKETGIDKKSAEWAGIVNGLLDMIKFGWIA